MRREIVSCLVRHMQNWRAGDQTASKATTDRPSVNRCRAENMFLPERLDSTMRCPHYFNMNCSSLLSQRCPCKARDLWGGSNSAKCAISFKKGCHSLPLPVSPYPGPGTRTSEAAQRQGNLQLPSSLEKVQTH